ncbi:50S ribosomal protein L15 [Taklimakanibacter lacteus]|uniref:50S ribosomal protein L15 n=1 Tax=Taklimakanibacter lacteus TaxID=2268456 RepID=UPI000E6632AC
MRLNQISDNEGARRPRKRLGRGIGSGLGKTAGRGGKGQTARSGGAKAGFEGGQMPIYRRLPKRGFNNPFPVEYNEINLGRIQQAFDAKKIDAGQPVTIDSLVKAGVVSKPRAGLRLLGSGELKAKLAFEVHYASKGAIAAVEKAGGSVKVLRPAKAEAEAPAREAKAPKAEAKPAKGEAKAEEKPAKAKKEDKPAKAK